MTLLVAQTGTSQTLPSVAVQAPRSRPSEVRLGSLPMDSEQDLRFVQDRLALFGKTAFVFSAAFLLLSSSIDPVRDLGAAVGRASHVGATLVGLCLWLVARARRELSPAALQTLDSAGTLSLSALLVLMGHQIPPPYGFYTGLLAVLQLNIARAVIVPSVPSRTLVLSALGFCGVILSRSFMLPTAGLGSGIGGLIDALAWSAGGTALAGVASKVVYGLQERALEARQLGQYVLEEKIGEGGMGEIYRARHAMLRRPTAVKLLIGDASEQQLRRFEKEVQLTARLTHPNTISVYDYGRTPDGTFYYAMELLDGMTLETLVERHGPQPPARVLRLLLQVTGALSEAHGIGLIHRDIKPANISLGRRGGIADFVKVLDFGLVREVRDDGSVTRSNLNFIVGTPLYLSPEAILSPDKIDARADIYGLGCVAYLLLTGTPPFSGRSVVEICGHHLHSPPQPPSTRAAGIPADLERIVLSCLAKSPDERPQSARALGAALSACEDAGGWSEEVASAWWACVDQGAECKQGPKTLADSLPQTAAGAGGERRTICCADIARRLRARADGAS